MRDVEPSDWAKMSYDDKLTLVGLNQDDLNKRVKEIGFDLHQLSQMVRV